jgi:GT2 family glycosyltransferase
MILNYNGQRLLKDCLRSALEATSELALPCPVVVVDNCSTEGDEAFIRSHFPGVEIFHASRNDFLFSYNEAIASRQEDVVIILNNDMVFDRGFIAPLLRHFQREDVFASSAQIFHADCKTVITARSHLVRRDGWYTIERTFDDREPRFCYYAAGGACALRRSMFLELEGFDTLFRPGYSEEVDLSYRAWRRGWRIIYEPASKVTHLRSASFAKRYSKDTLQRIIYRNRILFNVKNCGDGRFLLRYLARLVPQIFRGLLIGNRNLALAAISSLPRLPLALIRRRRGRGSYVFDENAVIEEIDHGRLDSEALPFTRTDPSQRG